MNRLLILALIFSAGCVHGTTLKKFETARTPQGVQTRVTFSDHDMISGELIAAEDDRLVIGTSGQLVGVAYVHIEKAAFLDAGYLNIGAKRVPGAEKRKMISLLSRFPQGLDDVVLSELLLAYGQADIITLP